MVEIWMVPLDGPIMGGASVTRGPQRKQLTIRQQRGKRVVIRPELWDEDWTP